LNPAPVIDCPGSVGTVTQSREPARSVLV